MEALNVLIAIGLIHCSLFFFDTIFKVYIIERKYWFQI